MSAKRSNSIFDRSLFHFTSVFLYQHQLAPFAWTAGKPPGMPKLKPVHSHIMSPAVSPPMDRVETKIDDLEEPADRRLGAARKQVLAPTCKGQREALSATAKPVVARHKIVQRKLAVCFG